MVNLGKAVILAWLLLHSTQSFGIIMVARHTHTRCVSGAEKGTGGSLDGERRTGNQVKGDGYMERSKGDDKSVMKKEWRRIEGGAKKEGCPAWGSCSSWWGKGSCSHILWLRLCSKGEDTVCVWVCVLQGVVTAGDYVQPNFLKILEKPMHVHSLLYLQI